MARKSQAPKTPRVPRVTPEGQSASGDQVRLKITVGRETARLLKLEAFGQESTVGQIVENLVRACPRRFVLVDRSKAVSAPSAPATPSAPRPSAAEPPQEPQERPRPLVLRSDVA